MTSQEFVTLREHDKIRFIGDSSRDCYNEESISGLKIKKPLIKGKIYTVLSKTVGELSLFGVSGIPQRHYFRQKSCFPFKIPILTIPPKSNPQYNDWELIEIRYHGIELHKRSKLGIHGANRTLEKVEYHLNHSLNFYKGALDGYLNNIPIEKKVLLLASFRGKQKKILEFLFEYKDFSIFIDQWYKGAHPDESDNFKS